MKDNETAWKIPRRSLFVKGRGAEHRARNDEKLLFYRVPLS